MDSTELGKLNAEVLQLRNQQFLLGTIALTGSGLSAWIAPGISAIASQTIEQPVLLGATLSWLVMLYILFVWALSLRRLITIISEYIRHNEGSPWEEWFFKFHGRNPELSPSQTRSLLMVFVLYGLIAVGGSWLSTSSPNVHLSGWGRVALVTALLLYLLGVGWKYQRCRRQNAKIGELIEVA